MYKVNNKKTINNIALKSFKANKTRNIVAIIAIILTALMFTSVFTVTSFILHSFEQSNFRQVGGYVHGSIKGIEYDDIELLANHPLIDEYSVTRMFGVMSEGAFVKNAVEVRYADELYLKHSYVDLAEGEMPKEGTKEVIADTGVFNSLGIEPVLGMEITLTVELFGEDKITDTFILSGYWQKDEAMPVSFAYIPKDYVDSALQEYPVPKDFEDTTQGRIDFSVLLKDSNSIESDIITIINDAGFQTEDEEEENYLDYGVNWGYISAQAYQNFDAMSIVFVVMLFTVFMLSGYLIIYNVFKIGVSNDIRFYGLLKTIGTTPSQIKKILYRQAFLLFFVGAPIGLALGYAVGFIIAPFIMASLNTFVIEATINPYIFIGGAALSFVTLLISVRKPAKIASRISPIEAVRYSESNNIKKKTRKTVKAKPFNMAMANLSRNKGKSFVVIASISLALLVLQVSFMFSNGFNMQKYLEKFAIADFLIAHNDYFNFRFHGDFTFGEEDIDYIKNIDGVINSAVTYATTQMNNGFYSREEFDVRIAGIADRYNEEHAQYTQQRALAMGTDDSGNVQIGIRLHGLEDFAMEQIDVIDGSLEDVKNPNSIVAIYYTDDYGNLYMNSNTKNVGDTIKIRHASETVYYNLLTNEPIEDGFEGPFYEAATEYIDVEYTVIATATMPANLGYRSYNADEPFILHADVLKQHTEEVAPMNIILDVEDEKLDAVEQAIKEYTTNINSNLNFESTEKLAKEFEGLKNIFVYIGAFLSMLIGFIGILNFFNTILTSINTRKREFAMLQSVGMTGKQLKNMLTYESLSYIVLTSVTTVILTFVLSPMLNEVLSATFWFYESKFNILPLIIVIPILLLIGVCVPAILYKTINRQSIVERLRQAE